MNSTDNAIAIGMENVLKTFESLDCLVAIQSKVPVRDDFAPDFWYPGGVWSEIEDSDQGRRFEAFVRKAQGALEFPVEGLRSIEITLREEDGRIEVVVLIHLFDPEDIGGIFAWITSHLRDCWQGFLKSEDR